MFAKKVLQQLKNISAFYSKSVNMNKNPAELFTEARISSSYVAFRPDYPIELKERIKGYSKKDYTPIKLVVDAGCGSGQSTLMWADECESVIGFDISESQIKNAPQTKNNVIFKVSSAYNIPTEDSSVDLITIAQTMHWLEKDRFYSEVKRALKLDGVLAVFGYGNVELSNTKASELVKEVIH